MKALLASLLAALFAFAAVSVFATTAPIADMQTSAPADDDKEKDKDKEDGKKAD